MNQIKEFLKKTKIHKKYIKYIEHKKEIKKKSISSNFRKIITMLRKNKFNDAINILDVNLKYIHEANYTFLHLLCNNERFISSDIFFKVIQHLNDRKVNLTVYDDNGELPLYTIKNITLILKLLKKKNIQIKTKYGYSYYHLLLLRNKDNKNIIKILNKADIPLISRKIYCKIINTYAIKLVDMYYSNRDLLSKHNIDNRIFNSFLDNIYENIYKSSTMDLLNRNILINNNKNFIEIINNKKNLKKNYPSRRWLLKCIIFFFSLPHLDIQILYDYTLSPEINMYHNKYRLEYIINGKMHILTKSEVLKIIKHIHTQIPKLDKNLIIYRGIEEIGDSFNSITSFSLDISNAYMFAKKNIMSLEVPKNSQIILPLFLLSAYPHELECSTLPTRTVRIKNMKNIKLIQIYVPIKKSNNDCNYEKKKIIKRSNDEYILCDEKKLIILGDKVNYIELKPRSLQGTIYGKKINNNDKNQSIRIKKEIKTKNKLIDEIKNGNISISIPF